LRRLGARLRGNIRPAFMATLPAKLARVPFFPYVIERFQNECGTARKADSVFKTESAYVLGAAVAMARAADLESALEAAEIPAAHASIPQRERRGFQRCHPQLNGGEG
jgi:hypothetical protein